MSQAAENDPFKWNVFLGPWKIIEPFPAEEEDIEQVLAVEYLQPESTAEPGDPVIRGATEYQWQEHEERIVDFDAFFEPEKDIDHVVAYAWTSFYSDKAQDAVLSVGSDDGFDPKLGSCVGIRIHCCNRQ